MAHAISSGLARHVRNALGDRATPPWLPGLGARLAASEWSTLSRDPGLTSASYGTARLLRKDPDGARLVAATINIDSIEGIAHDPMLVELLPSDLARECSTDLRFLDADDVQRCDAKASVVEAFAVLAKIPTLVSTLHALIRVLHLIDTGDEEIDVSFSDPHIPFSVFLSIPGPRASVRALRLAEAFIHEAMHLQLTLIESIVPLVTQSERAFFSPWRDEYRTSQGVLHALYVFRVIYDAFAELSFEGEESRQWMSHTEKRLATIATQMHLIREFIECPDLTADGRTLVVRLLL